MSEVIGDAYVKVRPDTTGFEATTTQQIRTAGTRAGSRFGSAFKSSFSRQVAGITGGILLAGGIEQSVRGAVRQVKALTDAAKDEEARAVLLSQALKNLGVQTRLYGQDIDELIEAEARAKGFTDTDLTDAFIRLVTATKDSGKAFRDLALAEDIARQRKISVTQVALLLARAEQGVFTSVRRLGLAVPTLSKEEQKLSKERQKRILTTRLLTELEEKFGGTAERISRTAVGAEERLQVAFGELREDIGRAFIPRITELDTKISDYLGTAENQAKVQRTVNAAMEAGDQITRGLIDGVKTLRQVTEPLVDAVGGLGNAVQLALGLGIAIKIRNVAAGLGLMRTQAVATERVIVATAAAETGAISKVGVAADVTASQFTLMGRTWQASQGLIIPGAVAEAAAIGRVGVAADVAAGKIGRMGAAGAFGGRFGGRGGTAVTAGILGGSLLGFGQGGTVGAVSTGALVGSAFGPVGAGVGAAAGLALANRDQFSFRGKIAEDKVNRLIGQEIDRTGKALGDEFVHMLTTFGDVSKDGVERIEASYLRQLTAHISDIESQRLAPPTTISDIEDFRSGNVGTTFTGGSDGGAGGDAQAVTPLTADFRHRLDVARAIAAGNTRLAEQLYRQQLEYVDGQIARLERDKELTKSERNRLLRLLGTKAELQADISSIEQDRRNQREQDAADAKQKRDEKRAADKQAAQEERDRQQRLRGVAERRLQIRLQIAQASTTDKDDIAAHRALIRYYKNEEKRLKATGATAAALEAQSNILNEEASIRAINDARKEKTRQDKEQARLDKRDRNLRAESLREQRLALRAQQAQLTKSDKDDIAAQRALIRYYRGLEKRLLKSGAAAKALEAKSNRIGAQLTLRGLQDERGGDGASVEDFFSAAVREFRAHGSNITGRGGILSGQRARGALAGLALADAAPDRAAQILAVNSNDQLTEQQKQTQILRIIAERLSPKTNQGQVGKRGSQAATVRSRQEAAMQSLGGHGAVL